METEKSLNFIEQKIENDITNATFQDFQTRFPPEPNGYLHIGHAKAICLNFGLAQKYKGKCNLRFDDTNPVKEKTDFVNAIKEDISWLGFEWDKECYASDYFDQLFEWAKYLIQNNLAYIDEQTPDQIAEQKGNVDTPGTNSPFRDRPAEESLDLFEKMRDGAFEEGKMVLRAKIDMTSDNMHMRDPIIYRILKKEHHRTGNKWNIYPMYDFAHGQSDYLEGVSHSLCSLEFRHHRALYDWLLDKVYESGNKPVQTEFARLNIDYTVMSKRKLEELVNENIVSSWDDPRLPTISGLRRRGIPAEAIRDFCDRVGVAKRENIIEYGLLEFSTRNILNKTASRLFGVLNPVKLVIENYPENEVEWLDIDNNPEDENSGSRKVPFGKELWIEREDFMEDAPRKYFRLSLDKEVRLKGAYIIKGTRVEKDAEGNIQTIYCTYDTDSKSGSGTEASNRKVKGTIHFVECSNAVPISVNVYDRLFSDPAPDSHADKNFKEFINPDSLKVVSNAFAEPEIKNIDSQKAFQFQRLGYYIKDKNSTDSKVVLNRTVTLKDTWGKINK